MIKVQIKKQNLVTNQAQFETQELAEAWVLKESLNGSFGKLERWLVESDFRGESIEQSVNSRQQEVLGGEPITEYNFPQEFEIIYEDITTQLQVQTESYAAKKYLLETDWLIIREIDTGLACPLDIKNARSQARMKVI